MKAKTKQEKILLYHFSSPPPCPQRGDKNLAFPFRSSNTDHVPGSSVCGRRKGHSLLLPLRRGAPAPPPVAEVGGAAAGAAPRPYLRGRPAVPARARAAGGRAALGTLQAAAASQRNSLRPATRSCPHASHPCAWSIRPLALSWGRHTLYMKTYRYIAI